jgi:beta-glucosidase
VLMPWVDRVPAILEAWYPGEEDGNAVAAVLFGEIDPSGRLPLTFPRSLADLPASTPAQYPGVHGAVHYSEGVFVGYRHYEANDIEPLFPFGYGLSYTKFTFTHLTITPNSTTASAPRVTVDVNVTNSGERPGSEVVELYVGIPSGPGAPEPPKQLRGFEKLQLTPGETGHAHFVLGMRSFAYWNRRTQGWTVRPGDYSVMMGASSGDIRLQGTVLLKASSVASGRTKR